MLPASYLRCVSKAAEHRTAPVHHAASAVLSTNIPSAPARGQGTGAPRAGAHTQTQRLRGWRGGVVL